MNGQTNSIWELDFGSNTSMTKSLILILSVFFFSFAQLTTIDTATMRKIERKVKKLSGSKDIKLRNLRPQTPSHERDRGAGYFV